VSERKRCMREKEKLTQNYKSNFSVIQETNFNQKGEQKVPFLTNIKKDYHQ